MTISRRNSLVLPAQPPPGPIPPSLRQSPYLHAPQFTHHVPPARAPNDADERWLQDTVPLQSHTRPAASAPPPQAHPAGLTRARSHTARYLAHSLAPPPPTTVRPPYLIQARSAPNIHHVRSPTTCIPPMH